MIQFFIIVIGIVILVGIFSRRYILVEKGKKPVSHRKDLLKYFHHLFDSPKADEITANEIIPDISTIDPKKISKADSLLKRAEAYFEKGDVKNGEKTLIQSLSLNPACKEIYHQLGLFYLKQGQYGKAEMMYRKLVASREQKSLLSTSDDPAYYSNLGLALYQQNKLAEAKEFYMKAIELDATRAGRIFSLAQIFHELQEFDQALRYFLRAIELDAKNIDYLLTLAQFYHDREMAAEKQKLLDEILLLDADNAMALEMMKGKTT